MMAAGTPIRIGLVGAGMVSRHHLSAWAGVSGARVTAIADPDIARAERGAQAFDISGAYSSTEEMVSKSPLDGLDIAAPVEHHGALCRLAADHGLAILCQKPLASTVEEARGIVAGVAGRVRFMVHENWRFRASYRQIRQWLDQGRIGPVTGMRMTVTSSGLAESLDGVFPALRRQPFLADLPRLLVFEVLIHHIDILRWLCGGLAVQTAALSRACRAVQGEDTGHIRFTAPAGHTVDLHGCLCSPEAPGHICDHLEITGSNGTITLDDTTLTLDGPSSADSQWTFDEQYASAFESAVGHFVDRLADNGPFETEAADNIHVLQLVEDVYTASGAG